jgi:hypothetical protein
VVSRPPPGSWAPHSHPTRARWPAQTKPHAPTTGPPINRSVARVPPPLSCRPLFVAAATTESPRRVMHRRATCNTGPSPGLTGGRLRRRSAYTHRRYVAPFLSGGVTLSSSDWWRRCFVLKRVLRGFVLKQRCDFILEWLAAVAIVF